MTQESILDRTTYKKIKGMSLDEMQGFLMRYVDNLKNDSDIKEIDLLEIMSEIGKIKGIGEKCLDEIMSVIKDHLK